MVTLLPAYHNRISDSFLLILATVRLLRKWTWTPQCRSLLSLSFFLSVSLCIYNQRFLCPSQNHRFSNLKSSSGCSIHPASSLEHKLWCINRTSQNQHLKEMATTSDLHKGLRVYEGGCHCGAIRIRIEAPSKLQVHECNCSICTSFIVLMKESPFAWSLRVLACFLLQHRIALSLLYLPCFHLCLSFFAPFMFPVVASALTLSLQSQCYFSSTFLHFMSSDRSQLLLLAAAFLCGFHVVDICACCVFFGEAAKSSRFHTLGSGRKKGNLHLYVPPENFTQLSGKVWQH